MISGLVAPIFVLSLSNLYLRLSAPLSLFSSILISKTTTLSSLVAQDHPAQCHLSAERTKHIFSSQRGRIRHVPQVEGQQGQRQRIHRDHKVSRQENSRTQRRTQSPDSNTLLFPSHRKQVLATKADADRDGVKVPVTLDEYCVRTQVPPTDDGSNLLYDDYYDDEELDEDDEDDIEACCYDEDDSGTEDS